MNLNSMDSNSSAAFWQQPRPEDVWASRVRVIGGASRDSGRPAVVAAGSSQNFSHILAGEIQKGRRRQRPRQPRDTLQAVQKL